MDRPAAACGVWTAPRGGRAKATGSIVFATYPHSSAHAAVSCLACGLLHFVNGVRGKILADEGDGGGGSSNSFP